MNSLQIGCFFTGFPYLQYWDILNPILGLSAETERISLTMVFNSYVTNSATRNPRRTKPQAEGTALYVEPDHPGAESSHQYLNGEDQRLMPRRTSPSHERPQVTKPKTLVLDLPRMRHGEQPKGAKKPERIRTESEEDAQIGMQQYMEPTPPNSMISYRQTSLNDQDSGEFCLQSTY